MNGLFGKASNIIVILITQQSLPLGPLLFIGSCTTYFIDSMVPVSRWKTWKLMKVVTGYNSKYLYTIRYKIIWTIHWQY